jgi:fibronectin-binding autotransporter adhesin
MKEKNQAKLFKISIALSILFSGQFVAPISRASGPGEPFFFTEVLIYNAKENFGEYRKIHNQNKIALSKIASSAANLLMRKGSEVEDTTLRVSAQVFEVNRSLGERILEIPRFLFERFRALVDSTIGIFSREEVQEPEDEVGVDEIDESLVRSLVDRISQRLPEVQQVVRETITEREVRTETETREIILDQAQLTQLQQQIDVLRQSQQSSTQSLFQTIALTNRIDSLTNVTLDSPIISGTVTLSGSPSFTGMNQLGAQSATISGTLSAATTSISGALAVSGTGTSTFDGHLRVSGNFDAGNILSISSTSITITGTSEFSNIVATSSATSTFAGPVASGSADGKLILHGATTTGRLLLNPYGGNVGIGTTSPVEKLAVSGRLYVGGSGTSTIENNLHVRGTLQTGVGSLFLGDTFLQAGNGAFALNTNATSTFSTNGFTVGNNQFVVQQTSGNVGIGTTSPSQLLSVQGNALFSGDLNLANLTATGSATLSGASSGVAFTGTGDHDIAASNGILRLGTSTILGAISASTGGINIGSAAIKFGTIFVDTVNATQLVGTVVGGQTNAEDWVINADNASADTETMNLVFERGSVVPNALLTWDTSRALFDFNQPIFIQNDSTTTTVPTLLAKGSTSQTADIFQAATSSGAVYFNVKQDGKVGIGTTSPTAKLAVQGNALFSGDISAANVMATGTFTASGLFTFGNATGTQLTTTGSTYLATSGGSVGVGTESPLFTLDVRGDLASVAEGANSRVKSATISNTANQPANLIMSRYRGTLTGLALSAIQSGDIVGELVYQGYTGTSERNTATIRAVAEENFSETNRGSSLQFRTIAAGSSSLIERMRIDGVGNIGIGTTTPTEQLSVANRLYIGGTGTSTIENNLQVRGTLQTGTGSIFLGDTFLQAGNGAFSLKTNATSTFATNGLAIGTNQLVVQQTSGRVGIGTNNPSEELDVVGTIKAAISGSDFRVLDLSHTQSNSAAMIKWQTPSSIEWELGVQGANQFELRQPGGLSFMAFNPTGELGIGTTSPSQKLSVQGNALVSGNLTVGNLTATGTVNVGNLGTTSVTNLTVTNTSTSTFAGPISNTSGNLTIASTGTTNKLLLNPYGGNVGIGTDDPLEKLSVKGNLKFFHPSDGNGITRGINITPSQAGGAGSILSYINTGGSFDFGALNAGTGAQSVFMRITSQNTATPGNSAIALYTNTDGSGGIERMRVNGDGNVGVGTTSPSQRLSVQGNALFSGNLSAANVTATGTILLSHIQVNDSQWVGQVGLGGVGINSGFAGMEIQSTTAGSGRNLYFHTNNPGSDSDRRLTITHIGNVGIGTVSPSSKLQVIGDANVSTSLEVGTSITVGPTDGLGTITSRTGGRLNIEGNAGGPSDEAIKLRTTDQNGSTKVDRIKIGGVQSAAAGTIKFENIGTFTSAAALNGFGTTSPSQTLSVHGNALISGDLSLANLTATGTFTTSGLFTFGNASGTQLTTTGATYLATSGGNVGIGTLTPAARLDIQSDTDSLLRLGNSSFADLLEIPSSTSGEAAIRQQLLVKPYSASGVYGALDVNNNNSDASAPVARFKYDNDAFLIYGNRIHALGNAIIDGNVGIGTTSPTEQLSVANRLYVGGTGTSTIENNLQVRGTLQTGTGSIFLGSNFLNFNQAATIGLANTTNALNFDNNTLIIDAQNNRIGIGQTQQGTVPGKTLDVAGIARINDTGTNSTVNDALIIRKIPVTTGGGSRIVFQSDTVFETQLQDVASIEASKQGGGSGSESWDLAFKTSNSGSNSERIRIKSDGKFGIGTSTPAQSLSVQGNALFSGNLSVANITATGTFTTSGLFTFGNASGTQLTTTGSTYLATTGGNVGVGTTSPGSKLDIYGSTNGDIGLRVQLTNNLSQQDLQQWLDESGSVLAKINFAGQGSFAAVDTTYLRNSDGFVVAQLEGGSSPFFTVSPQGAEKFRVTNSGEVGIGTTTPAQKLSVQGNALFSGNLSVANITATGTVRVSNGSVSAPSYSFNSTTNTGMFLESNGGNLKFMVNGNRLLTLDTGGFACGGDGTVATGCLPDAPALNKTTFGRADDPNTGMFLAGSDILQLVTAGVERLSVIANGNVGIGTTSPTEQLSVANRLYVGGTGTSTIENNLQVRGTLQTGTGSIYLGDTFLQAGNGAFALNTNATSTFGDDGFAIGTNRFTIQGATGRVGIGTSNPSYKLHVSLAGTEEVRITKLDDNPKLSIQGPNRTWELVTGALGNEFFLRDATANLIPIVVRNNTSNFALVIDNSKVGINTLTPEGLLHVHTSSAGVVTANANADDLIVENNTTGGISILTPDVDTGTIAFGSPSDNFGAAIEYNHNLNFLKVGTAKIGAHLRLATDNGLEQVRILSNGNVGIGTTSPTEQLSVANRLYVGGTGTSTIQNNLHVRGTLQVGTGSTYITDGSIGTSNGNFTGNIDLTNPQVNNTGYLMVSGRQIVTYNVGANALIFGQTGGTLVPTMEFRPNDVLRAKLSSAGWEVTNDVFSTGGVFRGPDSSAAAPLYTFTSDTNTGLFSAGADALGVTTGGSERVRVTSGGNVGIGTTSPSQALAVQGNALFSGDLTVGNITATGTVNVGNLGTTSVTNLSVTNTSTSTFAGPISSASGDLIINSVGNNVVINPYHPGSGRLGIGDASPDAILEISQQGGGTDPFMISTSANGDGNLFKMDGGGAVSIGTIRTNLQGQSTGDSRSLTISPGAGGSTNSKGTLELAGKNNSAGNVLGSIDFIRGDSSFTSFDKVAGIQSYVTSAGTQAGQLSFLTQPQGGSPTERMVIDPDGKVGIGTTSPSQTLSVHGNALFSGNLSVANITATGTFTTSGLFTFGNASGTQLTTTGSTYLATSGGNVGIGTAVPESLVTIRRDAADAATKILVRNDDANGTPQYSIATSGIGDRMAWQWLNAESRGVIGTISSAEFSLMTSGSRKLTITSGGNVGIGTTTPMSQLTTSGTGGSIGLAVTNTGGAEALISGGIGGASADAILRFDTAGTQRFAIGVDDSDSAKLKIATNDALNTSRLTIDSSGNVGIGTTTPGQKLEVVGNIRISDTGEGLILNRNNGSGYVIWQDGAGNNGWSMQRNLGGETSQLRLHSNGNSANFVISDSFGGSPMFAVNTGTTRVGIGTTTPRGLLGLNDPAGTDPFVIGSGTPKLIVKDTGLVGIGTSSPNAFLSIAGSGPVSPTGAILNLVRTDGTDANTWSFTIDDVVSGVPFGSLALRPLTASDFAIMNSANTAPQFIVKSDGKVGIGTTSPTEQLSVANRLYVGGTGTSTIENNLHVRGTLQIGTSSIYLTGTGLNLGANNLTSSGALSGNTLSLTGTSGTSTVASGQGFTVGTNQLVVQQTSGRVGIGTTDPAVVLQIGVGSPSAAESGIQFGSTDTTARIYRDGSNGGVKVDSNFGVPGYLRMSKNDATIFFDNGGLNTNYIGRNLSTGNVDLSAVNYIYIADSTRLGIGTTSPAAKLGVNGTAMVAGKVTITNAGTNVPRLYLPGVQGVTDSAYGGIQMDFADTAVKFLMGPDDDGNNLMFRTIDAAGGFQFRTTNGGIVQTITDGGNVGIGTTSPTSLLALSDNSDPTITVRDANNNVTGIFKTSGTDNKIYVGATTNSDLALLANNGERVTVKGSGNVGIGTTTPARLLTVSGSGNAGMLINTTGTGVGQTAQIAFAEQGTEKAYFTWWTQFGTLAMTSGAGTDGIHFNPTTKNVGIGTTDPQRLLDISSTVNAITTVRQWSNNTTGSELSLMKSRAAAVGTYTVPQSGDSLGVISFAGARGTADSLMQFASIRGEVDAAAAAGDAPGRLMFFTTPDGSETPAERIRITNAGNVGIGTTTPDAKLTVTGQIHIEGNDLQLDNNKGVNFKNIAGNPFGVLSVNTSDQVTINAPDNDIAIRFTQGSAGERMRIGASGFVGIGTTSPGTLLSLHGGSDFVNFGVTSTSTFSKGINLLGGCFAVNGTCVGGGGGGSGTVNNGTQGQVAFYDATGTTVSGTSTLTISTKSNVGIGTTTPLSLLSLSGPGNSILGISLGCANTNAGCDVSSSRYIGLTNTTNNTNIGTDSGFSGIEFGGPASANEGFLAFHTHDAGANSGERLRIDKSGNVGIGTTSPSKTFSVGGNALISGTTTVGELTINNSFDAGSTTPRANTLYKENIIKGWINFSGEGTITIRDAFNVTSIVDNGTGDYTINWNVDFATPNYVIAGWAEDNASTGTRITGSGSTANMTAGSVRIVTRNNDDTIVDVDVAAVMAIGDQ